MKFRIRAGVVAADVAGEVTVLDPDNGTYFGLVESAAAVWRLLPATLDSIVDSLVMQFDVDVPQCRADVTELLADLVERGLVESSAR